MKRTIPLFPLSLLGLSLLSCSALSDAPTPPAAKEVRTFYIQGLECGGCVYMVQHALSETKGVLSHEVVQSLDSYAIVSFDPARLSEHRVAQTVREAMPVHGTPYLPSLRLRVDAFTQCAPILEAVLARFKHLVRLEVLCPDRGEVALHFLPLEPLKTPPSSAGQTLTGWTSGDLRKALDQAGPAGQAIRYQILAEAPQP